MTRNENYGLVTDLISLGQLKPNLLRMFDDQSVDDIEGSLTKSLKIRIEKFVKLTDPTYACNSLTNFEYKQSACNDQKRKLWTHYWPHHPLDK